MASSKNPIRGEIWLVSFDPQVAEEIKKTRPAVILSIKELRHLPMRTVVPIRNYEDFHEEWFHIGKRHWNQLSTFLLN